MFKLNHVKCVVFTLISYPLHLGQKLLVLSLQFDTFLSNQWTLKLDEVAETKRLIVILFADCIIL